MRVCCSPARIVSANSFVSGERLHPHDFCSAVIKVNEDGKALILSGEGECGQGVHTAMCQIAAEELGVRVEDVMVLSGPGASKPDTDAVEGRFKARVVAVEPVSGRCIRLVVASLGAPEAFRIAVEKEGAAKVAGQLGRGAEVTHSIAGVLVATAVGLQPPRICTSYDPASAAVTLFNTRLLSVCSARTAPPLYHW